MIRNIEAIKSAIGIREVLGHYGVTLDAQKKAPCPVHGGKHKNFSVKGDRAACWSQCGQTWDSIGIIEALEHVDFYEALVILAELGGVAIEYDDSVNREEFAKARQEATSLRESYRIANEAYLTQYLEPLPTITTESGSQVVMVSGRPLQPATAEAYYLRQLPARPFYQCYTSLGLSQEIVIAAGLVRQGDRGLYDVWRERWMYPTHDDTGVLVGFVGRIREDARNQDTAKYLNSDENELYHKRELLYGLYQAKRYIHKERYAILVEGQMDAISLYDSGICHTVAGGGTALTLEQAKRLAKYTQSVTLLYDADDAGSKAAQRAIPILLQVGMEVRICHLPVGQDPDSYVREHGAEATLTYITDKGQDAVIWAIHHDYVPSDVFKSEEKRQEAIYILGHIHKPAILARYLELLAPKAMMGSAFVKSVRDGLKQATKSSGKDGIQFTPAQREDIFNFSIYEDHHKYYLCMDIGSGRGWEISNFVIRPIMLVVGSERSDRLIEVINEHGQRFVRAVSSDDFVEVGTFKKQMERQGNFLYKGKPEHFIHVKEKVYLSTPTAYPIHTLGLHKLGFYAWANGLTLEDGQFLPVDEYGIVQHGESKFFLPAFSKVYQYVMSDDQDSEMDREFIYQRGEAPELAEWAEMMIDVYGDHGRMAMCWYFAAVYRDIIYKKFKFFPHLNCFGPPRSGKSFLGWSLSAMFGQAKKPFHLMQGTPVGLYRRMAQTRNALAWMDEYSNDLPVKVVEALKSAYDGVGHEKGVKSSDDRTMTTRPNSAILLTGQHQPTKDIALFTRCITLMFKFGQFSAEQEAKAKRLLTIQDTGRLSQITGLLHSYRPSVEVRWDRINEEVQRDLRSAAGEEVDSRMLANYSVPLTAYKLVHSISPLPWSYEEMITISRDLMSVQFKAIGSDDEVTVWWRIVAFALADRQLEHDKDVIVEEKSSLTIKPVNMPGLADRDTTLHWDKPLQLLFLRFERSHPLYLQMHKTQHSKQGLGQASLQHYLRYSKAYIGEVKSKRFGGHSKGAWVFDTARLPIELDLSAERGQYAFASPAAQELTANDQHYDKPDATTAPF